MYVDAAGYGYTGINARARPDMNAELRFAVNNGGRVDVVGQPVTGDGGEDWDIVAYQGKIGYARAKLLSMQPPGQTPPGTSTDVPDGLTPDEQRVSDAVAQSNTAWTAAMENASADGPENAKAGD